ncbi:MAG: agmatine deiminase family protein [Armatimonadetes bacterium]|nr:agmatine deiminase family protein [Armatimonadota bacterium]
MFRRSLSIVACAALSTFALSQHGLYADGTDVSRGPMPGELPLDARIQADPPSTAPPTGPVRCVAEYEPMEGIIVAWEGTSAQNAILTAMAKEFTSADGDANVYVLVDTASEQSSVSSAFASAGVTMSRVKFLVTTTDSIWCRDYGPRYIYQGGCRAIVKHTYNRNRPNDNVLSFAYGNYRGHSVYQIPLVHGGGNYHLDATGRSWATRLIANENTTKTEAQIVQLWKDYQNVQTTLTDPFSTSVDSTQHIDMWMQIIGDDKVMVSDWPLEPGSQQDVVCDTTASLMSGLGYQVFRSPAFRSGGTHYTYTNVVVCNGVVIVPSFSTGSYNAQALAAWQQAMPDKRIVQVNCQALVTSAGVVHCVVMHVPRYLGASGLPKAYVASPNGGGSYAPGSTQSVLWAADDLDRVTSVDVYLSTDGGATYPTLVTAGQVSDGSYDWTVPDVFSTSAKIKVVAHNASGLVGDDVSDVAFAILGADRRTPTDLSVVQGRAVSGGTSALAVQDQVYARFDVKAPRPSTDVRHSVVEIVAGTATAVPGPATMSATVVAKAIRPSQATLRLKNWTTGQWDEIAQFTLGTTDTVTSLSGIAPAGHVRFDGRIEADLTVRADSPLSESGQVSVDFLQFVLRP